MTYKHPTYAKVAQLFRAAKFLDQRVPKSASLRTQQCILIHRDILLDHADAELEALDRPPIPTE